MSGEGGNGCGALGLTDAGFPQPASTSAVPSQAMRRMEGVVILTPSLYWIHRKQAREQAGRISSKLLADRICALKTLS